MSIQDKNIATKCVQGVYSPKNAEPRVAPIVQSTTYEYDNCDSLANAFNLAQATPIYTRLGNPTLSALEEKIALLEGGVGAVTTASGQSAILFSVLGITKSGQNIISLRFVQASASVEEILALADENTRLIYAETIGNPSLDILDFEIISTVAKKIDIPFVVDNTFATPYLCRPFEHGANIVVHSTTKYFDGHATSVGGVVVDGGNYNWKNGKYPQLTQPDESYHGLVYTETFGNAALSLRLRAGLLRDIGSTMAPFNAFLTNLGLETLHLRMERHSQNALEIAKYLEKNEKIEFVNYPLLESSKTNELAKKYLPKGASGVVSFGIKGDSKKAQEFIDSLELVSLVTHVCDVRTLAIHPASTTHRQLNTDDQIKAGVFPNLIRLSVGIEDVQDIINDIEQALSKI